MTALTIAKIQAKKNHEKITMLTAYSAAIARILAATPIDLILVGDSLGMTFQGKENTLSVTLDEMIYHAKAVRQGAPDKFMIVDMPFMSFQVNPDQTLANAGRILQEANANAVKVEGAAPDTLKSIKRMIEAGIPVMGHLGFTPQGVNCLSGYKVQGKDETSAAKILQAAKELEKIGVFALVLEMIPADLAREITQELQIPTISCGAGLHCDGQVLVIDDLLGLYPKSPKFAKRYLDLSTEIKQAVNTYLEEVLKGEFPGEENCF